MLDGFINFNYYDLMYKDVNIYVGIDENLCLYSHGKIDKELIRRIIRAVDSHKRSVTIEYEISNYLIGTPVYNGSYNKRGYSIVCQKCTQKESLLWGIINEQLAKNICISTNSISIDDFIKDVSFTQREFEVFSQLLCGCTDLMIASALHISIPTVRKHIKSLFYKCKSNTRLQLVCKYYHSILKHYQVDFDKEEIS